MPRKSTKRKPDDEEKIDDREPKHHKEEKSDSGSAITSARKKSSNAEESAPEQDKLMDDEEDDELEVVEAKGEEDAIDEDDNSDNDTDEDEENGEKLRTDAAYKNILGFFHDRNAANSYWKELKDAFANAKRGWGFARCVVGVDPKNPEKMFCCALTRQTNQKSRTALLFNQRDKLSGTKYADLIEIDPQFLKSSNDSGKTNNIADNYYLIRYSVNTKNLKKGQKSSDIYREFGEWAKTATSVANKVRPGNRILNAELGRVEANKHLLKLEEKFQRHHHLNIKGDKAHTALLCFERDPTGQYCHSLIKANILVKDLGNFYADLERLLHKSPFEHLISFPITDFVPEEKLSKSVTYKAPYVYMPGAKLTCERRLITAVVNEENLQQGDTAEKVLSRFVTWTQKKAEYTVEQSDKYLFAKLKSWESALDLKQKLVKSFDRSSLGDHPKRHLARFVFFKGILCAITALDQYSDQERFVSYLKDNLQDTPFKNLIDFEFPLLKINIENKGDQVPYYLIRAKVDTNQLQPGQSEAAVLKKFAGWIKNEKKKWEQPDLANIPVYARIQAALKDKEKIDEYHKEMVLSYQRAMKTDNDFAAFHYHAQSKLCAAILSENPKEAKAKIKNLRDQISASPFENKIKLTDPISYPIGNQNYYLAYVEADAQTIEEFNQWIEENLVDNQTLPAVSGEGLAHLKTTIIAKDQFAPEATLHYLLNDLWQKARGYKKPSSLDSFAAHFSAFQYCKVADKFYGLISPDQFDATKKSLQAALAKSQFSGIIQVSSLPIPMTIGRKTYHLISLSGERLEDFDDLLQKERQRLLQSQSDAISMEAEVEEDAEAKAERMAEEKYPIPKQFQQSKMSDGPVAAAAAARQVGFFGAASSKLVFHDPIRDAMAQGKKHLNNIVDNFLNHESGQLYQQFPSKARATSVMYDLRKRLPPEVVNIAQVYAIHDVVFIGAKNNSPTYAEHKSAGEQWLAAVKKHKHRKRLVYDWKFEAYDPQKGMLYDKEGPAYIKRFNYYVKGQLKQQGICFIKDPKTKRIYFNSGTPNASEDHCREQFNRYLEQVRKQKKIAKDDKLEALQNKTKRTRKAFKKLQFFCKKEGARKGQYFSLVKDRSSRDLTDNLNSYRPYHLKDKFKFESNGDEIYIVSLTKPPQHEVAYAIWQEMHENNKRQAFLSRVYEFDLAKKQYYTVVKAKAFAFAGAFNQLLERHHLLFVEQIQFVSSVDEATKDRVYLNSKTNNDHVAAYELLAPFLLQNNLPEDEIEDEEHINAADQLEEKENVVLENVDSDSDDDLNDEDKMEDESLPEKIKNRKILSKKITKEIRAQAEALALSVVDQYDKPPEYKGQPVNGDDFYHEQRVALGRHCKNIFVPAFAEKFMAEKDKRNGFDREAEISKRKERAVKQGVELSQTISLFKLSPKNPAFDAVREEKGFNEHYYPTCLYSFEQTLIEKEAIKNAEIMALEMHQLPEPRNSIFWNPGHKDFQYSSELFARYYKCLNEKFLIAYNEKKKEARVRGIEQFYKIITANKEPRGRYYFRDQMTEFKIHFDAFYNAYNGGYQALLAKARAEGERLGEEFANNFVQEFDLNHPAFSQEKGEYNDNLLNYLYSCCISKHAFFMQRAAGSSGSMAGEALAQLRDTFPEEKEYAIYFEDRPKFYGKFFPEFLKNCRVKFNEKVEILKKSAELRGREYANKLIHAQENAIPSLQERTEILAAAKKDHGVYFTYYKKAFNKTVADYKAEAETQAKAEGRYLAARKRDLPRFDAAHFNPAREKYGKLLTLFDLEPSWQQSDATVFDKHYYHVCNLTMIIFPPTVIREGNKFGSELHLMNFPERKAESWESYQDEYGAYFDAFYEAAFSAFQQQSVLRDDERMQDVASLSSNQPHNRYRY